MVAGLQNRSTDQEERVPNAAYAVEEEIYVDATIEDEYERL